MTKPRSEFHRPLPAHDLPAVGRPFNIEAGPDERIALARRFGILAVNRLQAVGVVRPEANGRRVRLDGRLSAEVVQTCVVTLEPITVVIDVALERLYGYDVMQDFEDGAGEVFLDLTDDLPAEPLTEDILDVGAASAEQLALASWIRIRGSQAWYSRVSRAVPGRSRGKSLAGRSRLWRGGGSERTRLGNGCWRQGIRINWPVVAGGASTRRPAPMRTMKNPAADCAFYCCDRAARRRSGFRKFHG